MRQDAIALDFKGDILKLGEVLTVERLVRRGESLIEKREMSPMTRVLTDDERLAGLTEMGR